jgi:hypothetical protein
MEGGVRDLIREKTYPVSGIMGPEPSRVRV